MDRFNKIIISNTTFLALYTFERNGGRVTLKAANVNSYYYVVTNATNNLSLFAVISNMKRRAKNIK